MRLLLDMQPLLWAAGDPERLPAAARRLLEDPQNEPIFSSASLWEIAIRQRLGRGDFRVDVRLLRRGLLDNGYDELPITSEHAVALDVLPPIHKGPFDRILVSRAIVEGITLLTSDRWWRNTPDRSTGCSRRRLSQHSSRDISRRNRPPALGGTQWVWPLCPSARA